MKQLQLDPKFRQRMFIAKFREHYRSPGMPKKTKTPIAGIRGVNLENLNKSEKKKADFALNEPEKAIKFIMDNSKLEGLDIKYPLYEKPSEKVSTGLPEEIAKSLVNSENYKGDPLKMFTSFLPQLAPEHVMSKVKNVGIDRVAYNRNPGQDLETFINSVLFWRFREGVKANTEWATERMFKALPNDPVERAQWGEALNGMAKYTERWARHILGYRG